MGGVHRGGAPDGSNSHHHRSTAARLNHQHSPGFEGRLRAAEVFGEGDELLEGSSIHDFEPSGFEDRRKSVGGYQELDVSLTPAGGLIPAEAEPDTVAWGYY